MADVKTNLQDELWWQNLDNWIFDDAKIITYKNLSASLKVHVNLAKKMLYSFYAENAEKLAPSFLLAGNLKNSSMISVKIVTLEQLEAEEKKFAADFTKHLFSLSKKLDQNIEAIEVLNADADWRNNCDSVEMAKLRGIKHEHDLKVRKIVQEDKKETAKEVKKETTKEVKHEAAKEVIKFASIHP